MEESWFPIEESWFPDQESWFPFEKCWCFINQTQAASGNVSIYGVDSSAVIAIAGAEGRYENMKMWKYENDGLCIKNDGLCIENDGLCIENDGLCIENDGFCIENDGFWSDGRVDITDAHMTSMAEITHQEGIESEMTAVCESGSAKTPEISRKSCFRPIFGLFSAYFRPIFGLFWVKTTILSGHHSCFGTTYSITITQSLPPFSAFFSECFRNCFFFRIMGLKYIPMFAGNVNEM